MTGRYLKRTKRTESPSSLVFLHTESVYEWHPTNSEVRLASLRCYHSTRVRLEDNRETRRNDCQGMTADSFWEWLATVSNGERCTWIFAPEMAHHLTKLGFWERLKSGDITLSPLESKRADDDGKPINSWVGKLCLEDRPMFACVRRGKSTYKFIDTSNYWPNGIQQVSASLGIERMERTEDDSELSEFMGHARNRCEETRASVVSLILNWSYEQCGTFQMTAAMLAMANFRHKCGIRNGENNKVDIVCLPDHKSHVMERESLFGGRVQCFYVGEAKQKIYHVDCNSLYPFVMRRNDFPRRFVRYVPRPTLSELSSTANCYGTVARVFIHNKNEDFPIRVDGLGYHATGRFWATLCGPELARAIESDSIKRVSEMQVYSVAPIFRSWVDYWYGRKVQASETFGNNMAEYEFCKLILNSLSGKWAQGGKQWRDVAGKIPLIPWGGWPEYNVETNEFTKWRGVAGNAQKQTDGKEPRHSFPLITSYICAYGREYMRETIGQCGKDNVLYMATDSLILTEEGYERLQDMGMIHPYQLGLFKLKGIHDYCKISGSNHYQLDDKVTSSGLLGASLKSGMKGDYVEVSERIGTIISRDTCGKIASEKIRVPSAVYSFRGRIDDTGRWHPHNLIDSIVGLSDSVGPIVRPVYSLDNREDHITLACDA